MPLGSIWKSTTSLCMNYDKLYKNVDGQNKLVV